MKENYKIIRKALKNQKGIKRVWKCDNYCNIEIDPEVHFNSIKDVFSGHKIINNEGRLFVFFADDAVIRIAGWDNIESGFTYANLEIIDNYDTYDLACLWY